MSKIARLNSLSKKIGQKTMNSQESNARSGIDAKLLLEVQNSQISSPFIWVAAPTNYFRKLLI